MLDRAESSVIEPQALLTRAMIGATLAEAWRNPRNSAGTLMRLAPEVLAPLAEAWSAISSDYATCSMDELSLGELTPDRASVAPLVAWLSAEPEERFSVLEAVFGLIISKDCPPYETEFCHWNDPTYRSSQMADIGGFYRAFGLEPGRHRPERQDHVSFEIEFVSFLQQKSALDASDPDHGPITREALHAFVRDHAAWWMPTFAGCVKRRIQALRLDKENENQLPLLEALDGVCDLLRAWVAVTRIDAGVPAVREIIAPNTPVHRPEEEEEECGACGDMPTCAAS